MKKAVLVFTLLASTSLFAFQEIRCDSFATGSNSERVDLNIRFNGYRNIDNGRAELMVRTDEGYDRHDFYVMKDRVSRFNEVEYRGADFLLTIDTWPDRQMRPLRQYNARLRASRLEDRRTDLRCAYWN